MSDLESSSSREGFTKAKRAAERERMKVERRVQVREEVERGAVRIVSAEGKISEEGWTVTEPRNG